jgi:competence protein ComEA
MPIAFLKKVKKISYWIRNYFGFSQKEASGFVILIFLILIFLFLPLAYNSFTSSDYIDYHSDKIKLDSLVLALKQYSKKDSAYSKKSERMISSLSGFNPNLIDKNKMISLGFGNSTAERIIKYRKKGGTFRIKKDLLKIYGFPLKTFLELENFILLPDSLPGRTIETPIKILSFDINNSDTNQLKILKGIGSVLAGRIIKYRDKLGGYMNKDQFKEVYGLSPLALEELSRYTFIKNDFIPEKININTASLETLSGHPYITNKVAAILINYRKQHSPLESKDDIKEIKSMSADEINKILPYLNY